MPTYATHEENSIYAQNPKNTYFVSVACMTNAGKIGSP